MGNIEEFNPKNDYDLMILSYKLAKDYKVELNHPEEIPFKKSSLNLSITYNNGYGNEKELIIKKSHSPKKRSYEELKVKENNEDTKVLYEAVPHLFLQHNMKKFKGFKNPKKPYQEALNFEKTKILKRIEEWNKREIYARANYGFNNVNLANDDLEQLIKILMGL